MEVQKILIAGAGASGLMAALELSRKGFDVTILEGRDRTGGRIHTYQGDGFNQPVELGAEFIHGKLPVTLDLLKEYNIEKTETGGRFYSIVNGEFKKNPEIVMDYHHELEKKLKEVKRDTTVKSFLDANFPEPRYELLRHSVTKFVEGYDTADSEAASLIAFKDEWLGMEEAQYRIKGGYINLISSMEKDCISNGCAIFVNQIIKEIHWKKYHVEVKTSEGKLFEGNKIIITFPAGIWKLDSKQTAGFRMFPEVAAYRNAATEMGYGSLIKFVLLFKTAFWNKKGAVQWTGINNEDIGFIFSDEEIPTWWTQYPDQSALLTGWFGGPRTINYNKFSEAELLAKALDSLENIFNERPDPKAFKIVNWNNDPFSAGSYSYTVPGDGQLKKLLNNSVEDTIYLAGEALYTGPSSATVEAALTSGKDVANRVISSSDKS